MPGRRILQLAMAAVCLLWSVGLGRAQQLEKRIALVIGNSAYQAGPLATPANDAGLIAQTLQAAGFDVVGARDLDAATLRSSFREFIDKASASGPDTVAFVYFAGHGLQFEGENYLVPVDARIARDSDVPLEAVRLSDIVKPLAALPSKARIIVLDAARANEFAKSGQPLAGGLALMQPDPGVLIAFNAAPGTIAPEGKGAYGAYATALSEMIKEGGLPLDDLFERVRLRVNELTGGAELAWHVSRVEGPFLFFERTSAAPQGSRDRFSELRTRPIRDFDAQEAYLAALARDTMRGYLDFLAAYPNDPLARRVRAIVAARREAITWRESALADTPDAYWSYLRRYPHGPHVCDARRRLSHFSVAFEPPPSFTAIAYDLPPPPAEEIVYVERPVVYFADPVYDLPPPPPVPAFFLPPRPTYFVELAPPPPPVEAFVLPFPAYHPVPVWVERPAYVAPPPINIVNVNIHNTVMIDRQTQTAIVTNPAGQRVAPIPANFLPPQGVPPAPAVPGQPPVAQNLIQAHPVASAAIAAAAVALPAAAALRARQHVTPVNAPAAGHHVIAPSQPGGHPIAPAQPFPNAAAPGVDPRLPHPGVPVAPGQIAPGQAPAANLRRPSPLGQPGQRPGAPPISPVHGAQPLTLPNNPAILGHNPQPSRPGLVQTPPTAPNNPAAGPNGQFPPRVAPLARPPGAPAIGSHPSPALLPRSAPSTAQQPQQQRFLQPQQAEQQAQAAARARQQQQAAQQRALQAAQQQQAAQQRALHAAQQQQAAQQRALQAAQQQQAARQAAQQRAQQAAQQQHLAQQRALQAAQRQAAAQQRALQAAQQQHWAQQRALQAAQQQAAQQRAAQAAQQRAAAQQRRLNCGHPGQSPCH